MDSFRMDEDAGGSQAPSSPMRGGYFKLLEKVIGDNHPDAVVSPFIMPGLSDSRFFRGRGVPCYGIVPACVDMEAPASIHGVNERIALEGPREGRVIHLRPDNRGLHPARTYGVTPRRRSGDLGDQTRSRIRHHDHGAWSLELLRASEGDYCSATISCRVSPERS